MQAREIVSYFHQGEEEPEPLTEPEIQQVIQSQPVRADSSDSEEVLFTTPPRDPSPPSDA